MILHAIDKNAISLKKGKKYLVLVTYLPENFEIQQNTIIFVEKHLDNALRCSMENYGSFEYQDVKDNNAVRHVQICPLYAMSQMDKLLSAFVWENNQ